MAQVTVGLDPTPTAIIDKYDLRTSPVGAVCNRTDCARID